MTNYSRPLIIAHRGASAMLPENTLSAFAKAVEMGVDMIECDVRITKDNQLVVIHDSSVDRMTRAYGEVGDYTYDDLKKFKIRNNERVPLLEEVIDLVGQRASLVIEVKVRAAAKMVSDLIKRRGLVGNYVIQSFFWEVVRDIEKINPRFQTGILTWYLRDLHLRLGKKYGIDYINPHYRFLSKKKVKAVHRAGFKMFTWTVNTDKAARRAAEAGVDGLITNKPDLLIETFKK